MKFKQRGITLIALVVTIIVLLILAGVSISMLAGENGILKRAKEAKEKTEMATEEEQNTLLQYEYEIAKMQGEISETETFGEYSMEKEIKEKYEQDIKVGDTVNYDDNVVDYDGKWKVLGIENGQILLVSSKPVNAKFELEGKEGFLNLEKSLDEECIKFNNGKVAERARSLRVEDINRISGYNPEKPSKIEKWAKDTVAEYGTQSTFVLTGGTVKCKCSNGQLLDTNLNFFKYVDDSELNNDGSKITITNNGYKYEWTPDEYIFEEQDISLYMPLSDGIKSLFLSEDADASKTVWLANNCITANR